MKATTLLSAVALATALAGSAFGAVTSQNIVGYIKLSLNPGYNLVANQLNNGDNSAQTIFASLPTDGNSTLYKWNGHSYDTATAFSVADGGWDDATNMKTAPGDGVFIHVASAQTVTLVGEVSLSTTINLIKGYNLIASPVPLAGALDSVVGYTAQENDVFISWDGTKFVSDGYSGGFWDTDPLPPSVTVGQGFFLKSDTARAWTRTFSVN